MRRTVAYVSAAAAACVGLLAVAGPTGAASVQPGAAPGTGSMLGVVAQADGWLSYTNTMASSLSLVGAKTTTVSGTKGADGTCSVAAAGTAKAGSAGTYVEEVGFNPSTCQEQLLTGGLGAADEAKLAATESTGTGVTGSPAAGSATAAAPTSSPQAPTSSLQAPTSSLQAFAAAATSYSSAYTKTAWIDPVNITITSLTANLKWPLYGAGGTLSARVNPYAFPLDGWSSSGPSPIVFQTLSGNVGWQVRETDAFTNNDFAAAIYILLGPAGWAACGFHFSTTAHFHHDVTVQGYRNGNRGWAWNDSKDGACSNLVHHAGWDNYGWTS